MKKPITSIGPNNNLDPETFAELINCTPKIDNIFKIPTEGSDPMESIILHPERSADNGTQKVIDGSMSTTEKI